MKKTITLFAAQLMICVSAMAYDEVGCRIHVVRVDENEEQGVPVLRSQKYEKITLKNIPGSPYPMGTRNFLFKSSDEGNRHSYQVALYAKVKDKASSWRLNGDKLEVEAILYKLPDYKVVAVSTGQSDQVQSPAALKAMREGDGDIRWSAEAKSYVTVNKTRMARAFITLNNPSLYEIILHTNHPLIREMRDEGGVERASEFLEVAAVNGQKLVSPHMLKYVNIECVIEQK